TTPGRQAPIRCSGEDPRSRPPPRRRRQLGKAARMRLSELVRGLEISGDPGADPEVTGVTHDSRTVAPGDLFVAFAGQRFDGRAFATAAVAKGAVAVVGPESGEAVAELSVPWLVTADPRAVLGPLAARAYGHPERELILAGVTGTNGKSTGGTLVAAILDAAGP